MTTEHREHRKYSRGDKVAKLGFGSHVRADFGGGEVLAHLLDGGHTNDAGETKYSVQNPVTGAAEDLTYREPADRDAEGSGRTFWTTS